MGVLNHLNLQIQYTCLIFKEGKIPWRRKWPPSPVFLPGESHGQRSLSDHGVTELDTTEQLDDDVSIPLAGGLSSACFNRALCQRIHELGSSPGSSPGSTIHWPHDPLMNKLLHLPGQGHWIQQTSLKGIFMETEFSGTYSEVHWKEGHIKVFPGTGNKILNAEWRSLNKQTDWKRVSFLQNFSEALTLSCASGINMRKVADATLPKLTWTQGPPFYLRTKSMWTCFGKFLML